MCAFSKGLLGLGGGEVFMMRVVVSEKGDLL